MTAQMHEILILNGEEMSMAFCPSLPQDSRVIELKDNEVNPNGLFFSSACWRRYVGIWEIKDNKLYLVRITGKFKLAGSSPLMADWFTGVLRIPQGERLHYVHMGFGSVFEHELHIKIDKGVVIKMVTIDNRNKVVDPLEGFNNLPGFENHFDGDDI